MRTLLLAIFLTVLDGTVAALAKGVAVVKIPARHSSCFVNNREYKNGEIFHIEGYSMCIQYICRDAHLEYYKEACEHIGSCHLVGSNLVHDCNTYTCRKKVANNLIYYQMINIKSSCQDYQGKCHAPGSMFSYVIDGQFFKNVHVQL